MRLKLLSPGEMSADQKQTYDESIAGKRGKPPPPYCFGQSGTVQPLSRIRSNQTRCGSEENLVLRPPQKVSSSDVIGRRISGGQLASSQARVSLRNFSSSDISGVPSLRCWIDLSRRIAEFNISVLPAHAAADVVMIPDRVYSQSRSA